MKEVRKKQQREELRRVVRLNQGADSSVVVEKLISCLEALPNARIVAAYMALPSEVDLRGLFGRLDRVCVFPKVRGEDLRFYRVRDMDEEMEIGAYGIMEPREGLEEVRVEEVDVFLCPGLGFDRKGGRLGRGRGFYDRMLKQAQPDAVKIGVCFLFQIVDDIFMEEHDIRMDLVIW